LIIHRCSVCKLVCIINWFVEIGKRNEKRPLLKEVEFKAKASVLSSILRWSSSPVFPQFNGGKSGAYRDQRLIEIFLQLAGLDAAPIARLFLGFDRKVKDALGIGGLYVTKLVKIVTGNNS